jgi:putative endonuclease
MVRAGGRRDRRSRRSLRAARVILAVAIQLGHNHVVGWLVYLARCADDTLYCGVTNDLLARVAAHNAGKGARYTRSRAPIEIVLTRACRSKIHAMRLEYRIKQLTRADKQRLVASPHLLPSLTRVKRTASRTPTPGRGSKRSAGRGRRA